MGQTFGAAPSGRRMRSVMKDKRPNVAAGRLGDISLGAGSSESRGRARDSYNTHRLGIVSEAESGEPEIQAPAPEPQDVPQVVASERQSRA